MENGVLYVGTMHRGKVYAIQTVCTGISRGSGIAAVLRFKCSGKKAGIVNQEKESWRQSKFALQYFLEILFYVHYDLINGGVCTGKNGVSKREPCREKAAISEAPFSEI